MVRNVLFLFLVVLVNRILFVLCLSGLTLQLCAYLYSTWIIWPHFYFVCFLFMLWFTEICSLAKFTSLPFLSFLCIRVAYIWEFSLRVDQRNWIPVSGSVSCLKIEACFVEVLLFLLSRLFHLLPFLRIMNFVLLRALSFELFILLFWAVLYSWLRI